MSSDQNFNSTALSNTGNFRLLGMSTYQSVNSLQNSVHTWTFNRADRWKGGTYRKCLTDSIYTLPGSLSTRYTTFGYGVRKDFRPIPGRESPSPDRYSIRSIFDSKKTKGKTISLKLKQPVTESLTFKLDTSTQVPGPGTYNMQGDPNKGHIPIVIKSRVRLFYEDDLAKQQHCLSPQKYHPLTKLEENLRYRNITFGYGNRSPSENPCNMPH